MSTLSVTNLKHGSSPTNNIVLDSSGNMTAGGTLAMSSSFMRNRIINGAMVIDQRNAGASVTPTANTYLVDRWTCGLAQASKLSFQQSTTAPNGFSNSLLCTSLSAYTVGAAESFVVRQYIEGFNFADMQWGTANAQTITLSFWVRSSLTGTFGGSLKNSAADRSYPFNYTISAANTFEYKTVVISGDTTGTWVGATNGTGVIVAFSLGAGASASASSGAWSAGNYNSSTGATSVVGTNGATFYLTGVQLEVGTVATPFERRQYGQELALCQRYLPAFPVTAANWRLPAVGLASSNNTVYLTLTFPTTTRVPPTGMTVSAANHWNVGVDGIVATTALNTFAFSTLASNNAARITGTTSTTPFTAGQVVQIESANASANLYFTGCEL